MQVDQIIIESYKNKDFAVFNNAAQHWNHSFFWHCLTTDSKGFPTGKIKELINRDFKDFASFKQLFTQKAISFFGSGWLWLVVDHSGSLQIMELKDAQNPLIYNKKPLLALDLWEHAYYIDYRNARDKFIEGFWSIVNWEFANENLR
ncbi:superoxide dismutase [Myroides sp. LJL110]